MRRLHIVHVITRLVRGGAQRNTLMCAAHQALRGHRVTVVSGPETGEEGSLLEEAARGPYRLVVLPDLVREVSPRRDLRAFMDLLRLLAEGRCDVIHTHTSKAGILGRWAAWIRRVPAVIHTPHGHVFHGYFSPTRSALFKVLERVTARVTDRLVMLTDGCLRDHLAEAIAPEEKFVVIPSGVELDRFAAPGERQRLPGLEDGPVVGCVARLVDVKAPLDLVEAMVTVQARCPQARLVLVGDGPLRPQVEARIRDLGLAGGVILTGRLEDVAPVLRGLDLFVLPSRNEGMGRAAVEAMAAGLPVVATRVGGLPDVVLEGRTGLLVPPGDPDRLGGAIADLLEDPERARAMGQAGREQALLFSDRVMYDRLEALYEEVLGG